MGADRIRIDVDAATCTFQYTDEEPDGQCIFTTLKEAKTAALSQAVPERDAWASCVVAIRSTTLTDVTL